MERVALRPLPALHFMKARGSDYSLIRIANHGERQNGSGRPQCQCRGDVRLYGRMAQRNRAPSIKRRIDCGGRRQPIDVMMLQRLKPDMTTLQNHTQKWKQA
jgi:hypothetical protein